MRILYHALLFSNLENVIIMINNVLLDSIASISSMDPSMETYFFKNQFAKTICIVCVLICELSEAESCHHVFGSKKYNNYSQNIFLLECVISSTLVPSTEKIFSKNFL